METRAPFMLVGAFVLVLAASLFGFAAWLAKTSFEEAQDLYHIYFTGAVTGLQEGSPVNYSGVPVGRVTDIRIDPENVGRVRVTIEVPDGTPIKTDTIASLELQGITGTAFVQLAGGTQAAALLSETANGVPVIPSRPSTLAAVFEAAPTVIENLVQLSEQLSGFLSEDNQRAFASTLDNISKATGALAETTAGVPQTVEQARETLANVNLLVLTLRQSAETLSGQADRVLGSLGGTAEAAGRELTSSAQELRRTAEAMTGAANQASAMIRENRQPIQDFTAGSLYDLNQLITEVRDLAANIGRLTIRIERDPASFLLGGSRRGVQVE